MASANLDLVRSIFAAWERGDYRFADWAHREIEYVFPEGPTPGSWTGPAGMLEASRVWLDAWEDFRIIEAEEYRELDEERVLVLHDFSGRGRTSGLDVGQVRTKAASLFHIHDGKVTRLVHYFNRERALADLGLASETRNPE